MNPYVQIVNMDAFTQDEDLFAQSVRTLLAKTNIVRSRDEASRKLYRFCVNPDNHAKINDYLRLIGFRIVSDNNGVVYMTESDETEECRVGHQMLSTEATEMIKIIEWLYFEKEKQSSSDRIVMLISDIYDTIEKFGISYFDKVNAKTLDRVFREMASYNLVRPIGRVSQEDFRLEAYPSLKNFYTIDELRSIFTVENEEEDIESLTKEDDEVIRNQISMTEVLESLSEDVGETLSEEEEEDNAVYVEEEDDND